MLMQLVSYFILVLIKSLKDIYFFHYYPNRPKIIIHILSFYIILFIFYLFNHKTIISYPFFFTILIEPI